MMEQKVTKAPFAWYRWEFQSAADREFDREFSEEDLGRVAFQTDNGTFWVLTEITPVWVQVGGSKVSENGSVFEIGVNDDGEVITIRKV